jgi:chromatin remodeling complex protein RSC6
MSSKVTASSSKVTRVAPKKSVAPEASSSAVSAPTVQVETPKKTVKKVVKTPAVVETPVDTVVSEETSKKSYATSEDVISVISSAVLRLKEEAQHAKSRKDKDSVATLNELAKNLNSLKKPIDKLARSKPPRKQINIDKSRNGFLKPLELSHELAAFLGCDSDVKKSRVEVTRAICKYIDDNKLQNPDNRREIRADETLQKLLKFDPSVETEPLQYYMIQTRIQPHFIKPTVVA